MCSFATSELWHPKDVETVSRWVKAKGYRPPVLRMRPVWDDAARDRWKCLSMIGVSTPSFGMLLRKRSAPDLPHTVYTGTYVQ